MRTKDKRNGAGTITFQAPEIFDPNYSKDTEKSDIWALFVSIAWCVDESIRFLCWFLMLGLDNECEWARHDNAELGNDWKFWRITFHHYMLSQAVETNHKLRKLEAMVAWDPQDRPSAK